MHVLIIPGESLNPSDTYSSIFELHQAEGLRKNEGIKVGFISLKIKGTFFEFIKNSARSPKLILEAFLPRYRSVKRHDVLGFSVHEASAFQYLPDILKYSAFSFIGLRAFQDYIKVNGVPDIIHAHSRFLTAPLIARLINKKYKVPFVITEHSSYYARNIVTEKELILAKKTINNSSDWIVVSPQLGELIKKRIISLNKSYNYIPNVLDPDCEKYATTTTSSLKEEVHFNFLNIASLDANKAQKNLIIAFAKEFKGNARFKLTIGGDGQLRPYLEELAKELEVEDQVVFLGHLSRIEVFKALADCSAFVLSSKYETFGVVLIEALSFGKPIIAPRCGGPETIINESNGILADSNSAEDISDAMSALVGKYKSYNPKQIQKDCLELFSASVVSGSLINSYKEVLSAYSDNNH
jgi:L-malate glycosyltransferase